MNALCINTAGSAVEILLHTAKNDTFFIDPDGRKASAVLLPAVDALLTKAGLSVKDIDLFGCCIGPGSFTGIRIGAVTVRTFAQATGAKTLGMSYHRLMGFSEPIENQESIVTVIHGWGNNCYLAVYAPDNKTELLPPAALTYAEADTLLRSIDEPYALIADSAAASRLNRGSVYDAERCFSRYLAAAMGEAGDYATLEPLYVLASQAERELKP